VNHQISNELKKQKSNTVWNILKDNGLATSGGVAHAHHHPAASGYSGSAVPSTAGGVHRAGYIHRRHPAPRGWPVPRSGSRGRSTSRGRSPARRY
jgi:hypothetical protein